MIVASLAALAMLLGALFLYLASPHQALVAGIVRAQPLRLGGAVLLAAALVLLLTLQGPATAVFTWITGAMLIWSIVPIAARWWRFRRDVTR